MQVPKEMVNPVSSVIAAALPTPLDQVVGPGGAPTAEFHRFLTGMQLRTGGDAGVNAATTQASATQANQTAQTATTTANTATTVANTASTTALAATTVANTAQALAAQAMTNIATINTTAMFRSNNLSDLGNLATARDNLGVSVMPVIMSFDTLSSGLRRGVPMIASVTLPANFAGSSVYIGVSPGTTNLFTVSKISGGVTSVVGAITVVGGGGYYLSPCLAITFNPGDVLLVQAPSPVDPVLAQLTFAFAMTL